MLKVSNALLKVFNALLNCLNALLKCLNALLKVFNALREGVQSSGEDRPRDRVEYDYTSGLPCTSRFGGQDF
jgi:hypothetical protein